MTDGSIGASLSAPGPTRLRAAWILTPMGGFIQDGEIVIEDGRILDVRPARPGDADGAFDFGDSIVMPGLVNVHTHLEYTVMRGLLEEAEFFPWIRELTARKAALDREDWIASATIGAAEGVAGGVTTIGDCTDSGAALYGALALGLRGVIYQEVFGITALPPANEIVEELAGKVAYLRAAGARSNLHVGISPHAPYTVRPELMRALAHFAAESQLRICIHAAESQAEGALLKRGKGPFAEMYVRRGIEWEAPKVSTVSHLHACGILRPGTLLVHGVQVSAGDFSPVRESGAAWAHCPKSNAKLGVGVAPLALLGDFRCGAEQDSLGAAVGIGTDSVASNNTMDMFEEMRFAVLVQRAAHRDISALTARDAVWMATSGGARALSMDSEIGSLEPGKRADLCAVSLDGLHAAPCYDPYSALVYAASASDVTCTVIDGNVRYDAARGSDMWRRFPGIDLRPASARLKTAARKMHDWKREVR